MEAEVAWPGGRSTAGRGRTRAPSAPAVLLLMIRAPTTRMAANKTAGETLRMMCFMG